MTKVILFTHQKGGVGKSTLTLNVAFVLSEIYNVCIVDVDTQGSLLRNKNLISGIDVVSIANFDKALKSEYDYVLIDTPPYIDENTLEFCKIADAIIVPTKIGLFDAQAIDTTIDIIKKAKSNDKALIVCNMVLPKTTLTSDVSDVLSSYGTKISSNMIPNRVAYIRSILTSGLSHDEKLYSQIKDLTNEILELTN